MKLPADCAAKYEVERLLGQGGCGTVLLATQRALARRVAVKLLNVEMAGSRELADRFAQEARITASLSHPHIVIVLDFGAETGAPWIAYEYLPGRTLRQVLQADGPFGWREAVEVALQITAAIEEAHGRGILHRDIKPANVIEVQPGAYKVTDFGVATWAQADAVHTRTGHLVGSPAYMAPEVLHGEPATPRSDVWSLGVVLHELVTGSLPDCALPRRMRPGVDAAADSRSPGDHVPGLPAELCRAVERALAARPEDRMESAAALHAALVRVRDSGPPAAPPPSPVPPRDDTPRPRAGRGTDPGATSRPLPHPRVFPVLAALTVVLGAIWLALRPAAPPPAPVLLDATPRAPATASAGVVAALAELEARARALRVEFATRGKENGSVQDHVTQDPTMADLSGLATYADGVMQREAAPRAEIDRLSDRLDRLGAVAELDGRARLVRAALRSLDLRAWERVSNATHLAAVVADAKRVDSAAVLTPLTGLGLRLDEAYVAQEGVPRLTRFLDATHDALEWIAVHPSGEPTDALPLLSELGEVRKLVTYIKWLPGPKAEVERALRGFRGRLAHLSGPAGPPLGRVVEGLWDWRDWGRDQKKDNALLADLMVRVEVLRPLAPCLERELAQLADQARSALEDRSFGR